MYLAEVLIQLISMVMSDVFSVISGAGSDDSDDFCDPSDKVKGPASRETVFVSRSQL